MGIYSDRLLKLAKKLEDSEVDSFVKWIISGLYDVGLEHKEMCAINRPHSHSADCDCGRDELQETILNTLIKG